jgi:5'-3' exoribonuclease 1
VTDNRGTRPGINTSLTMPNTFPSRDRSFISTLSTDLHLSVAWDEYDEEDQNLVTWRLPGSMEEPIPEPGSEPNEGEDDEQWEDVSDEDDEESQLAVDRVLKKYEKAPVKDDDEGGGFDARHEISVNHKMDEWKSVYYKVSCRTRSLLV